MRHALLVARLQWLIFRNSLRKGKRIFDVVLQILAASTLAVVDIVLGVSFAAALAVLPPSSFDYPVISLFLAAMVGYWQFFPLLTASSGLGVDVSRFRHFPVEERTLFVIDLFVGLFDITSLSTLPPLVGIAVGLTARDPEMLPAIALGLVTFVAFNVALMRFLARLFERVLANRRAKELLVVGVFCLAFVPQLVAVVAQRSRDERRDDPARAEGRPDIETRLTNAAGYFEWTPPGLTAKAITGGGNRLVALGAGTAFAAAMLAIAARQLAAPYRGRGRRRAARDRDPGRTPDAGARAPVTRRARPESLGFAFLPRPLAAMVSKEIKYVYRSPRTFVVHLGALLGPAVFAMFVGSWPSKAWLSEYTLPGLCLFSLWQVAFLFTNALCFDSHGAKLYFVSPVRGADVLAGKNLVAAALVLVQATVVVICYQAFILPLTPSVVATTLLIIATAVLLLLAAGNVMSSLFPHPVSTQKLGGQSISGFQLFVGMFAVAVTYCVVAVGPVAGRLAGSEAVTYAVLGVEVVGAIALYAFGLAYAGRLLERRAERVLEALTKEG